MFSSGLVVFAASFISSIAATFLARKYSPRIGLVDIPSGRKNHERVMPLGGGQAMYAAFVLTVAAGYVVTILVSRGWGPSWLPHLAVQESERILAKLPQVLLILGVGTGMMILGWIDDAKNLSALVKLFVQIVLAVILVAGGIRVTVFLSSKILSGIITVLWIVGVVNAFNFLDNMDGLCAGVALIAGAIFVAIAIQTGQVFVATMLLAYLGMLTGFLIFNFHPASIFMGDAGSFFVGYLIAVLTVVFTFRKDPEPVHTILTPVLILALPIFDMACVIGIRLFEGKGLLVGDHNHVSHRLAALGMSTKASVLTICLMTFCTGLAAVMLRQLNRGGAICGMVQVICFLVLIFLVERAGRKT